MDVSAAPTVGVVVCTHRADRLPSLLDAVVSLEEQTRRADRVIVVVDGDRALERIVRTALGKSAAASVEVLGLGSNQGVSVARTHGATALDTDLVGFLDDDAVAHSDWLEVLVAALDDDALLGVGGRSEAIFTGPRPRWLPEEFLWTVGASYRGQPQTRARVRNVFGGCAVLRRDVFVELGGYDPAIGHRAGFSGGGEEADYCLRASAATGGTFAYEPATGIDHLVPPGRLTWRYFLSRCLAEGRMKAYLAGARDTGALSPERSFAVRLPLAAVRYLVRPPEETGRRAALGVVAGAGAVVLGLLLGARTTRGGRR